MNRAIDNVQKYVIMENMKKQEVHDERETIHTGQSGGTGVC